MQASRSPTLPVAASPRFRKNSTGTSPFNSPLTNARGGARSPKPSVRVGRFRLRHLIILLLFLAGIFYLRSAEGPRLLSPSSKIDAMTFCPHSTARRHTPTVILQGDNENERDENRTYWIGGADPAPFLPLSYPPKEMRFAQTILDSSAQPPPQAKKRPGQGNLGNAQNAGKEDTSQQVCKVHKVASSPSISTPPTWSNNRIMFGMSTTADRTLYHLPVWSHWVPSSKERLDVNAKEALKLPQILILSPPPNPTEAARMIEAVEEANGLGINVVMRKREADRFERRYFLLGEEMWVDAEKRKAEHGIETDWFIFCDDDTFFPDWDALVNLLSAYDPSEPVIIGALSESTKQVTEWGRITYGGAGIYLSRAMLELFNRDGQIQECLDKFGSAFGGDAMVAHCAALVTKQDIQNTITFDDTLHQIDIRGDGTGFFQSGFAFTSLHHWGSWFTLFPPWSESGSGDLRKGITLVGKAAKAVNGFNWGRRYVFEDGKVVVNLGYSVTIEGKALTESELSKSEHTWWEFETFHPIRNAKEEAAEKRTYYLTGVRHLERDVVKFEHKNREGERVDIVWDARAKPKSKSKRKAKRFLP